MFYQISHQTTYKYSQAVFLKPHLIRLCPRSDNTIKVRDFSWTVQPQLQGCSSIVDLDGNNLLKVWFEKQTKQLNIQIACKVETSNSNPFNYLLESWATTIPFDYPVSLHQQLQPYLSSYPLQSDRSVTELAQEIALSTNYNTLDFLFALNQRIYQDCQYIIRESGAPYPGGITWSKKQGSCRDYAVLFMAVCRAVGIAARFVSGYQEGDVRQESRDLHAWVEVYLPGAGWRGYDPTLGLVVGDRHIPLAASAIPQYTAAVTGLFTPLKHGAVVTAQMDAQILIVHG